MTTYLGEKAVGIGTVKANMNVGKVITDEKTILGDGFTEQLAVNTLLFATSESVAASAEAVRTEFDGRLKAVEGEITNVEDDVRELRKGTHDELVDIKLDVSDLKDVDTQIRAEITNVEDRVRELTKYTDGEFVDIKLDVSDLKDADQNIRTEIAGIQTQVTAQIAGKQDKLTAGENITIEDGVISATGGGASGDYLPLSGGTLTGNLDIAISEYKHPSIQLRSAAFGRGTILTSDYASIVFRIGFLTPGGFSTDYYAFSPSALYPLKKDQTMGAALSPWTNVYTTTLNNGADIAIPTTGGTMALKEDIDAAVGDISTALTAILGE